jgi:hypothetical protein
VFTNPNDENSIDCDELQLALTEEWGDKEAAQERREELEKQKQQKIREAQEKQMKAHIKNLSLGRGALEFLTGKEGSGEYKKRIALVDNVEKALKANPVFTRHDILEKREPFLYNSAGMIFHKGDIIITDAGRFQIDSFNYKKQELSCTELLSGSEKKEKMTQYSSLGYSGRDAQKIFKAAELHHATSRYSYNSVHLHIEKVDESTKQVFIAVGGKEFYSLPHDKKEMHYDLHIDIVSRNSRSANPIVFSISDNGYLNAQTARYRNSEEEVLNPFSSKGKEAILKALSKGIQYNKYDSQLVKNIGETIPELKAPVQKAIESEQKKEEAAALEAELHKQAQAKLNADKEHQKSRVRVAR